MTKQELIDTLESKGYISLRPGENSELRRKYQLTYFPYGWGDSQNHGYKTWWHPGGVFVNIADDRQYVYINIAAFACDVEPVQNFENVIPTIVEAFLSQGAK